MAAGSLVREHPKTQEHGLWTLVDLWKLERIH